jgi:ABC-2 type transport system ATP-binding protein
MSDDARALLVARDLTKVFRTPFLRRRVEALRGVSFAVEAGSVTGFLGANGAGKTTTLKVLLGLLAPTSGTATLFGQPVPSRKARERIGFMPESPSFPPNQTAREIVAFAATVQGASFVAKASEESLARAGLEHGAWDRPTSSLSKGQAQRVGLAAAIVADPDLLILDEPMSGLDPLGRAEVLHPRARRRRRSLHARVHDRQGPGRRRCVAAHAPRGRRGGVRGALRDR